MSSARHILACLAAALAGCASSGQGGQDAGQDAGQDDAGEQDGGLSPGAQVFTQFARESYWDGTVSYFCKGQPHVQAERWKDLADGTSFAEADDDSYIIVDYRAGPVDLGGCRVHLWFPLIPSGTLHRAKIFARADSLGEDNTTVQTGLFRGYCPDCEGLASGGQHELNGLENLTDVYEFSEGQTIGESGLSVAVLLSRPSASLPEDRIRAPSVSMVWIEAVVTPDDTFDCGGNFELCCDGDTCDEGLACNGGRCWCGSLEGEVCCDADPVCDTGLECVNGSCECGQEGQVCCSSGLLNYCRPDHVCDETNTCREL